MNLSQLKSNFSKLILVFLLVSGVCHAQADKYEDGIKAFEAKNYLQAYQYLSDALEEKYLMKGRDVPLAFNYRAKAIAALYNEVLQKNSIASMHENKGLMITAFNDLSDAKKFDDGRCAQILSETNENLLNITFKLGQFVTDSLTARGNSQIADSDSIVNLVRRELMIVSEKKTDDYQTKDMLGVLAYKSGDFEESLMYFSNAEKNYEKNPPPQQDVNHVYNYYYSALINHARLFNFKEASISIKKAERFIDNLLSTLKNENDQSKYEQMESLLAMVENLDFQIKLSLEH